MHILNYYRKLLQVRCQTGADTGINKCMVGLLQLYFTKFLKKYMSLIKIAKWLSVRLYWLKYTTLLQF